jgi:hypothetical protein
MSAAELAELRPWFAECDADEWDRGIERDPTRQVVRGKSVADHLAGKSREI